MKQFTLIIDPERVPEVAKRYSPEQVKDMLVKMLLNRGEEVTEKNMQAALSQLESDLEGMFS